MTWQHAATIRHDTTRLNRLRAQVSALEAELAVLRSALATANVPATEMAKVKAAAEKSSAASVAVEHSQQALLRESEDEIASLKRLLSEAIAANASHTGGADVASAETVQELELDLRLSRQQRDEALALADVLKQQVAAMESALDVAGEEAPEAAGAADDSKGHTKQQKMQKVKEIQEKAKKLGASNVKSESAISLKEKEIDELRKQIKALKTEAASAGGSGEGRQVKQAQEARDAALVQVDVLRQEMAALKGCLGLATDESESVSSEATQRVLTEMASLDVDARAKKLKELQAELKVAKQGSSKALSSDATAKDAEIRSLKKLLQEAMAKSGSAAVDSHAVAAIEQSRDSALQHIATLQAELVVLKSCLGEPIEGAADVPESVQHLAKEMAGGCGFVCCTLQLPAT